MSRGPCEVLVDALDRHGFDPMAKGADTWESRCPAHNGERRNLSITQGDGGRALVCCHARGCKPDAITQALGLAVKDLFPAANGEPTKPPGKSTKNRKSKTSGRSFASAEEALAYVSLSLGKPTRVWTYHDPLGAEVMRVARFEPPGEPKSFRPIHRSSEGWRRGDPPGPLPLYRLSEVHQASLVLVLEGEKAADAARGLGLVATTTAHGAMSAHKTDLSPLAGKTVVILPDNDEPGEAYLSSLVDMLSKLEPRPIVKVVRLAQMWKTSDPIPDGGDLCEWLSDGTPDTWTDDECRAELERLVDENVAVDFDVLNSDTASPSSLKRPRVKLTRASEVVPLSVEWVWKNRVPKGMLTMFAGDPKLGKSFVTLGLAAAVSRGIAAPNDDPPDGPADVLIMSAEDDMARTIVPRLKSAGADLRRIHMLESVYLENGNEALPSLTDDIEKIEEAVLKLENGSLIIIDPVSAYLGKTDDHKNAQLRGVLSPLKALAARTGAAVVLVSHLNKGAGTNGLYRVTGSIAYAAACRSNFLFVRDRDDPSGHRVFMLPNGCNLSPSDVPTLAYRIEDRGEGPAIEWEAEPVDITAEEALQQPAAGIGERNEASACDKWLREILANGPVLQSNVLSQGEEAGFSKPQLEKSKKRIRATSGRKGFGPGAKWYWQTVGAPSETETLLPIGDP